MLSAASQLGLDDIDGAQYLYGVDAVPEPGRGALLAVGLAALIWLHKRSTTEFTAPAG